MSTLGDKITPALQRAFARAADEITVNGAAVAAIFAFDDYLGDGVVSGAMGDSCTIQIWTGTATLGPASVLVVDNATWTHVQRLSRDQHFELHLLARDLRPHLGR